MCGIIGCVGRDAETLDVLLSGLANLEYRGYDSAGVALGNGSLSVVKRAGELDALRAAVDGADGRPSGTLGIGHTRWSTHGPPTDDNAHPHVDCTGSVAVVHNGIVENYQRLRDELEAGGHRFRSETDTEVIPHLIEAEMADGASFAEAFRATIRRLEGSYAVAAVAAGEDVVLATRRGSPLVLGVDDGASYLASDVPAFLAETNRVVYLEDGEVARLDATGWSVTDGEGEAVDHSVETVEWDAEETGKGGYDHYMLKEIHEQPGSLRQCIQGRVDELTGSITVEELEGVGPVDSVHVVGCGTSFHAALYAAQLFRDAGLPAQAFLASEYASSPPPIPPGTLVAGITQSGETADTLSALREAMGRSAPTLAVTNVVGSTAARECEHALYIRAGPEIGVAATKTFSSQVTAATLLVRSIAGAADRDARTGEFVADLRDLPGRVQEVLDDTNAREVAEAYVDADAYFFIGRELNYPVAMEAALKMKEITYRHAEGFAAGELKHGPLALVSEDTPVFATVTGDGEVARKTIGNVKEVETRGAPVVVVTDGAAEAERYADTTLTIPETDRHLMPVLANVQYQLVAYHTASLLGRSIDKPRHLAKSVTVE